MTLKNPRIIGILFSILLLVMSDSYALAAETISDAKIKAEVHHMVIREDNGVLRVFESIRFNNTGTETYVGSKTVDGQQETLKISLPLGYSDLQFMSGTTNDQVKPIQNGVVLAAPIPPDSMDITFTYTLPISEKSTAILKTFYYQTGEFYVLTPSLGSKSLGLAGQELYQGSNSNINGTQYKQIYTRNLIKNKKLTFLAINSTQDRSVSSSVDFHSQGHIERWLNSPLVGTNPHYWLIFIVFLLIAMIAAIVALYRRKRQALNEGEVSLGPHSFYQRLQVKKRIILEKILALEDDYSSGNIDAQAYAEMKNKYKDMLKKVKLKMEVFEET